MRGTLKIIAAFLSFFTFRQIHAQSRESVYQFSVTTLEGDVIQLSQYSGKKLLIVNTASQCGLTPQLGDLEKLYKDYHTKGLEILGFPSNDFAGQEPGSNEQIRSICRDNYGVTFQMMSKISVKGRAKHPLYVFLTDKKKNGYSSRGVRWNFQKFLIDENGYLVGVVSPWKSPFCSEILNWLNK